MKYSVPKVQQRIASRSNKDVCPTNKEGGPSSKNIIPMIPICLFPQSPPANILHLLQWLQSVMPTCVALFQPAAPTNHRPPWQSPPGQLLLGSYCGVPGPELGLLAWKANSQGGGRDKRAKY